MMVRCPQCYGSKRIFVVGLEKSCPGCKGTGEIEFSEPPPLPENFNEIRAVASTLTALNMTPDEYVDAKLNELPDDPFIAKGKVEEKPLPKKLPVPHKKFDPPALKKKAGRPPKIRT